MRISLATEEGGQYGLIYDDMMAVGAQKPSETRQEAPTRDRRRNAW